MEIHTNQSTKINLNEISFIFVTSWRKLQVFFSLLFILFITISSILRENISIPMEIHDTISYIAWYTRYLRFDEWEAMVFRTSSQYYSNGKVLKGFFVMWIFIQNRFFCSWLLENSSDLLASDSIFNL